MRTSSLGFCGFGSLWPHRAQLRALNSDSEIAPTFSGRGDWSPKDGTPDRLGGRVWGLGRGMVLMLWLWSEWEWYPVKCSMGRWAGCPPKSKGDESQGRVGVICTNIPSLETLSWELFGCLDQTWKVVCFKRNHLCIISHGGSTIHICLGNQSPPPKPGRPSGSFPHPTQVLPGPTCVCQSTMWLSSLRASPPFGELGTLGWGRQTSHFFGEVLEISRMSSGGVFYSHDPLYSEMNELCLWNQRPGS